MNVPALSVRDTISRQARDRSRYDIIDIIPIIRRTNIAAVSFSGIRAFARRLSTGFFMSDAMSSAIRNGISAGKMKRTARKRAATITAAQKSFIERRSVFEKMFIGFSSRVFLKI